MPDKQNKIVELKQPEKKQSARPKDPVIIKPVPEADPNGFDIILKPFPDGSLLKHGPNNSEKAAPNSRQIFDGSGQVFALAKNLFIADLLCKGAHLFFVEVGREVAAAKLKEQAANGPVHEAPAPEESK